MNATCNLIKKLREESGLSAVEFSKIMNVSKSSISKWENNEVPSLENLYQIARFFRITVDELLRGEQKKEKIDILHDKYDLSIFDVKKLIEEKNEDGLIAYFVKWQNILQRFLKLLPKAAFHGLNELELEEYNFLKEYVYVSNYRLDFKRTIFLERKDMLDPNEMEAVKNFYESIDKMPKHQKEWEIRRILGYNPKYPFYVKEIRQYDWPKVFVEMYKCLSQTNKDRILNKALEDKPLNNIRNKYVLLMLKNGGRIFKCNYPRAGYWDEDIMNSYKGKINLVDVGIDNDYYEKIFNVENYNAYYSEYLNLIDNERMMLYKEACELRQNNPVEYYKKLRAGNYDALLNKWEA